MMRKDVCVHAAATAFAVLGLAAAFVGCTSSSGSLPMPGELVTRGTPAGADTAALRRGRALAATECASCHRFYWPHEYTQKEWPAIVRKMGNLASLSESQIEDLELYLVESSSLISSL